MATEAVLQVRNLTKTFGATRALTGVTLDFFQGEIHCVLGENGAGKSTLGKIIGGLYSADEGEVLFEGRAVNFSDPREARSAGVTMVYQELSRAPLLSIRGNLWLGSERRAFPLSLTRAKHEREIARKALARLGMDAIDVERPVRELPMAMQQLVEIGKSLMFEPKVVIFDEPTAMLGAVEKERFFEVLRSLRASGIAAVLVTHHIEDVMAVGDRVTIMRNGSVVDSFPMTEELDAETVVERLTGKRQSAVEHAEKDWSSNQPLLHIDNLDSANGPMSLAVGRGEIVGFYGVVGCGAERLLAGLVGLERRADLAPVCYRIAGKAYAPHSTSRALRKGVAYLPAGRASNCVLPSRSIRDNLLLTQLRSLTRFGLLSPRRERERCTELLENCGVKFGHAEDRITSLSGGNQQKVLLARAMACAKTLLVLEEPTAGVDIEAKRQIHIRVRAIAESGIAVVLTSSDLLETISLCDTVVTMYAGNVANIYRQPTINDQPAIIADVLGQREAANGKRVAASAA